MSEDTEDDIYRTDDWPTTVDDDMRCDGCGVELFGVELGGGLCETCSAAADR